MTSTLQSLAITTAGCLSLAHWHVASKPLWLALGIALTAAGLSLSGLDVVSTLRACSRWCEERAKDWLVVRRMANEAPGTFREWRREIDR